MVSKSIYKVTVQLVLNLRSDAYEELTNVTIPERVYKMHDNFQLCIRNFRTNPALSAILYNFDKYHKAAVAYPKLCPILLLLDR